MEFEDQSDKCGCPRIFVHLSLLMKYGKVFRSWFYLFSRFSVVLRLRRLNKEGKLVDKSKHETFVAKSSLHLHYNSRPKAVLVQKLLNLEVYGFKINTKAHLDLLFENFAHGYNKMCVSSRKARLITRINKKVSKRVVKSIASHPKLLILDTV